MHELSLIESVARLLKGSAAEHGIRTIKRVCLVVGKMTMAVPEALQFAFETLREDELFREAVLEIREEPVSCQCQQCYHEFTPGEFEFLCPSCGSPRVKITKGRELYIDFYEGE